MDFEEIWMTDMRIRFSSTARSIDGLTWDEARKVYSDNARLSDSAHIHYTIMAGYVTGVVLGKEQLRDDAKKLLDLKEPNLERKLPWYNMMFGILDKGTFCGELGQTPAGPWSFDFDDDRIKDKLIEDFAKEAKLTDGNAGYIVERLCDEMGNFPGLQYEQRLREREIKHRPEEISVICWHLHMPVNRIIYQPEIKLTTADYFMGMWDSTQTTEKLPPALQ